VSRRPLTRAEVVDALVDADLAIVEACSAIARLTSLGALAGLQPTEQALRVLRSAWDHVSDGGALAEEAADLLGLGDEVGGRPSRQKEAGR
jgi:hypothetical protein